MTEKRAASGPPRGFDPVSLARPEVMEILPYEPGKPAEEVVRERGIAEALKFASNESPLGPSPAAREAAARALSEAHRYPDGGCFHLRRALADRLGVEPAQLIFGCGSNEVIEFVCLAFVRPGDEVVMGHPAFLSYAIAARVAGGVPVRVPLSDFRHDLPAMADAITERTRVVYVANPNNPTGTMVTTEEVERFLERVPPQVLVVFDEAYREYIDREDYPNGLDYLAEGRNVVVLRTFSKVYGLAGLRVGYGISHADTAGVLNRVRRPFNVNRVAQEAALAALGDEAWVAKAKAVRDEGLAYLSRELAALGLSVVPSEANFLLVELPGDARPVVSDLEGEGCIVRPLRSFGMGDSFVRVTVGMPEENRRLVAALTPLVARMR